MMKAITIRLLPLAAGIILTGCGGKAATGQNATTTERAADRKVKELALPELPESLTDPSERAAYATAHFWDAFDPSDHSQSLDTAFMEQSFANFAGILHYVPVDAREQAVGAFVDKCVTDTAVNNLAAHIAQHYLDDPNSPMRDEELYIHFLRKYIKQGKLSETKMAKASYRLEQAMKNRPGTRASDFRLVTRDGRTSTLLRELKDTTLVLFYDHDCGHCKETVERLASPRSRLRYPVIAVEVTEDREGWEGTKKYLPSGWTVAFATDPIDGEAYYFPALPSGYLLTGDGTVLVKDGVL